LTLQQTAGQQQKGYGSKWHPSTEYIDAAPADALRQGRYAALKSGMAGLKACSTYWY
jgi:hypothetical protein